MNQTLISQGAAGCVAKGRAASQVEELVGNMAKDIEANSPPGLQKTTFTVLGICCASEARLISTILDPLEGIDNVSVNVLAKTASVIHDAAKIPASRIASALNKAHLKAEIKELGHVRSRDNAWPSPYVIASGVLLLVASFSYVYRPLIWVAPASIAVGIIRMLQRAVASLRRLVLDVNVLMVIAVVGALALGDYLEGASIVFLFTLAGWLEEKSTEKARASLESLLNLAPRTAVVAETGETVDVKDVKINTVVSVKAGEFVPVDGVVVAGASTIDESSLTGEFMPVDKVIGSKVWAGTVVLTGFVNVVTEALEEDSTVARMVKLVEDAESQRSKMEEFIEQFSKWYTPGVVLVAAATAIVPWALGVESFHQWIYLALVLLVIACPCALVISTPVAKVCGLSAAAKVGLIIKGGNHLEALARVKAIAFDKTGTLTEGAFNVLDLQPMAFDATSDKLLYWIASLENMSSHPMAKALVECARSLRILPSTQVLDFKVLPGEGICGVLDGSFIQIGNTELALRNGWIGEDNLQYYNQTGITVGFVGRDDRVVGFFSLGDRVREEAEEAIQALQEQKIHVTVLTGDSTAAAGVIRRQIGEDIQVEARLSPEDKMKKIAELKNSWGLTAMVGDGINDAPALAASDIGIAMGIAGSAVAMETADVALMSNDLRKIPEAVGLAKAFLTKVYQNVAMSLAVKLLFFGLAFAGISSLWAAVVADMGTCLLVIFNSMHLLHKYAKKKPSVCPENDSEQLPIVIEPSSSSEATTAVGVQGALEEAQEPFLQPKKEERAACSCCKGR